MEPPVSKRFQRISIKPVRLTMSNVGPFRHGEPQTADFVGPRMRSDARSKQRPLADMFMIVGESGCGKSTILDCISGLFQLLDLEPGGFLLQRANRDAQVLLELLVKYESGGKRTIMLLKLGAGTEWPDVSDLPPTQFASYEEGILGFAIAADKPVLTRFNDRGLQFLELVRADVGGRYVDEGAISAPNVLQFRPRWTPEEIHWLRMRRPDDADYRPVHDFMAEEGRSATAATSLLRWMSMFRPIEFEAFLAHLNFMLFERSCDPKRLLINGWQIPGDRTSGDVVVDPHFEPTPRTHDRRQLGNHFSDQRERCHGLSSLSSGEQMLFQLDAWLRICSTRSTIVLIDEIDVHLSPRRTELLMADLEQFCSESMTTVIFTTHDRALIERFSKFEQSERRRGGIVITDYRDAAPV